MQIASVFTLILFRFDADDNKYNIFSNYTSLPEQQSPSGRQQTVPLDIFGIPRVSEWAYGDSRQHSTGHPCLLGIPMREHECVSILLKKKTSLK